MIVASPDKSKRESNALINLSFRRKVQSRIAIFEANPNLAGSPRISSDLDCLAECGGLRWRGISVGVSCSDPQRYWAMMGATRTKALWNHCVGKAWLGE